MVTKNLRAEGIGAEVTKVNEPHALALPGVPPIGVRDCLSYSTVDDLNEQLPIFPLMRKDDSFIPRSLSTSVDKYLKEVYFRILRRTTVIRKKMAGPSSNKGFQIGLRNEKCAFTFGDVAFAKSNIKANLSGTVIVQNKDEYTLVTLPIQVCYSIQKFHQNPISTKYKDINLFDVTIEEKFLVILSPNYTILTSEVGDKMAKQKLRKKEVKKISKSSKKPKAKAKTAIKTKAIPDPVVITINQAIELIKSHGLKNSSETIRELKAFEDVVDSILLYEGDAVFKNFDIGTSAVIVNGNLNVQDTIADCQRADNSILIVLGDVSCKNLLNLSAMHISGNLEVRNVLLGDSLCDYTLSVGGNLTAPTILDYGHSISVKGKISARDIHSFNSVEDISGAVAAAFNESEMVDEIVKLDNGERLPDLPKTIKYIRAGGTVFRKT